MSAWKNLECKTAKTLAGIRNGRGMDFGLSVADVEHPRLSMECMGQ